MVTLHFDIKLKTGLQLLYNFENNISSFEKVGGFTILYLVVKYHEENSSFRFCYDFYSFSFV